MNKTLPHTAGRVLETARRAAFRPVLLLSAAFVAVSAAMIAYLGVASAAGIGFDTAIWIRCSLVLASAIVVLAIAVSAARGSRGAWVRLRIVSPIIVTAVVVIVSIPGFLPDWVRLEQAVCGLLLLPVAILVNLPRMSAHFPKTA
ncbi:MAG: hypothetical protein LBE60_18115 [Microbacterium sp.]|jgi:hypothetical protein|uniref:hypothetical protein n=1 Tax=Microbacterium sp. TaxID=51671 RepID=UPI002817F7B6|nr:hypothetical protein [Microbacterium sp.]MDR2323549.1 hypothetical protein [Microbacterium sp.]